MSNHLNVVAGKNDSGKSAFLEAFRLLLTGMGGSVFPIEDIRDDEQSYEIHFIAVGSNKDFGNYFLDGHFENREVQIKCVFQRSSGKCKFKIWTGGTPEPNESTDEALFRNRLDTRLFIFDADRNLKQATRVGSEALQRLSLSGDNAASIVDDITNSSNQNNKEFNEVMVELFGYTIGSLNAANEMKIIGRSNKYGTPVKAYRMGSGISEVAYLLAHIISSRKKVVVIDEIEKSLHPDLLKKMLEVLARKSIENDLQFIIGTHSNVVLTQLGGTPDSKIYKTGIADDQSSVRLVSKPEERQELLVELGNALGDFGLYEGFILTEESTAQTFLEKIVLPKFYPDLATKIKVVASDGTGDVNRRYALLGKLHLFQYLNAGYADRTWVICDGDNAGREVIGKLKVDFPEFQSNFFNLETDKSIEHYYPKSVVAEFLKDNDLKGLEELLTTKDWNRKRGLKTDLLKRVLVRADEKQEFFESACRALIDQLRKIKV